MEVSHAQVFNWTTVPNALLRGTFAPAVCATVSFRIHWTGVIRVDDLRDTTNRFEGQFKVDTASVEFTAHQPGIRVVSQRGRQQNEFSELGQERNGVFFS